MSTKQDPIAWFQKQFDAQQAAQSQRDPEWLTSYRKSAMLRFAEVGFPTKKYEEWKYTNLRHLLDGRYTGRKQNQANLSEERVASIPASIPTRNAANQLVFVDGIFDAAHSTLADLPEGVQAGSLSVALHSNSNSSETIRLDLGKLLDARTKNPLTYLNMAFFEDGAYIYIPRNTKLSSVIELVFVSSGTEEAYTAHPRNIVHVESGAEVTFVERYMSLVEQADYWSNPATALFIENNASVHHIKIQDEARQSSHLAQMHVEQGRDSQLSSHLFTLGGKTSRHEIETVLNGENIRCTLSGLYLAGEGQRMDNRIFMEHNKPHGFSDQYYKGVLLGNGVGSFSGRIFVQREAQKTDAYQTHQALLLSDGSSVYSKPQLEIYADDVKCSHGATTGNIDETALFYLRSRGIPKEQAEHMLVLAFAEETVERIANEDIKEHVHALIAQAMRDW